MGRKRGELAQSGTAGRAEQSRAGQSRAERQELLLSTMNPTPSVERCLHLELAPCRGHPRGASPSPQCPLRPAGLLPHPEHKRASLPTERTGCGVPCSAHSGERPPAVPRAPRPGRSPPCPARPGFCLGRGAAELCAPAAQLWQKVFSRVLEGCGRGEKGRGAHP